MAGRAWSRWRGTFIRVRRAGDAGFAGRCSDVQIRLKDQVAAVANEYRRNLACPQATSSTIFPPPLAAMLMG